MADVIHHLTKKYGITGELVVRPCVEYVDDGCRAVRPTNDGEAPEFYGVYERKPDGHGGEYEEWVADFNDEAHANLFAKSPKMLALLERAIPQLILLGNYIGNEWPGGGGIEAFDRCALIGDVRALLSELEVKR